MSDQILISIIDDDEAVRKALARLMKSLGYRAETFESSADFLASGRRGETRCLIADVQMPGMSGFELYSQLKAEGAAAPTILITAHPDEVLRQRALEAGVLCHLTKPFDEGALLACIRTALGEGEPGP